MQSLDQIALPTCDCPALAADSEVSASTGIEGLDDILRGGFARDRLYLIEGVPGSG
ncbi:MAG: hypothetical protein H7X95_03445, partial [Deltaproteobacteria bacterium]|nr:hypothetical protein [Deltaproteobacteria bacterium]